MPQANLIILITLNILISHIVLRWALKKIVGSHSRTKRLWLQFLFCLIFSVIFASIKNHLYFNKTTFMIIGVGFLNGFACYASWKTIDISLSKSALFTFGKDLIAMTLSYIILQESKFINLANSAGIILCLTSTISLARYSYKQKESAAFFYYTAFYSIIWGITLFLARYLAFNKLPTGQFLFSWYTGALIAASLLVLLYKDADASQQGNEKLNKKDILYMLIYSSGVALCLGLVYGVYSLAPQITTQPILMTTEVIFPAIVGLFIFNEKKTFDKTQWRYSIIGIIGIILIAFGYWN